jgi:hypothetical protein
MSQGTPPYYLPGFKLYLRFSDGADENSFTVVRTFQPFTMAQVLLVESSSIASSKAVLKVYDPRFMDHSRNSKMFKSYKTTWSHSTEAEATRIRQAKGPEPWAFIEIGKWPGEDDQVGWEEWFYQRARSMYYNEVTAYDRLKCLQGAGIPILLGHGQLCIPRLGGEPSRAIIPNFTLMSYVDDSITLENIDPNILRNYPMAIRSVLSTTAHFSGLGVIHNDPALNNYLFTPSTAPKRAVVIDFGNSFCREEEDDEEWAEIAEQNDPMSQARYNIARALGMKSGKELDEYLSAFTL